MNSNPLNDIAHFAGAALAALVLGLLLSWAMDRLLLRRLIADRIAGIALSCAIAFVLLMAGTTLFLTLTLAEYIVPGIVIPPMGIALSYLAGLAVAGALRIWAYGKEYEEGDEQLVFDPDYMDHSVYDAEVVAFDERFAGRNYLVRHWAGNLSLPMSYWVNGALLSTLILAGTRTLAQRIQDGSGSLQSLAIVVLAYLGISAILWVWSSVGIWRSAYWHRRRGGTPGWGVAARALLVITAVATLLRSGDIALQMAEFGQLATGRDSIGPIADMKVSKNGRELILSGSIASGAAKRFETVLQAHPGVTVLVLTSSGGRILEAERIASLVRARRLDTRVDQACMSACTSILLAGRERTAEESAQIGFHAPRFPGFNAAEMRASVAAMRTAYLAAGVDPAFVARALTTPAENMWYPSYYELESAGVLTGSEIIIRRAGATAPVPALDPAQMQRELQAAAAQTNASAPTRLDETTTLTRATASGLTLTYYYTIEGAEDVEVVDGRRVTTKMLRAQACRQPQVAKALGEGARFVYSYSTTGGRHLFDVEVTSCPKA